MNTFLPIIGFDQGRPTVSSLQLAGHFGIKHHNVLRDIKAVLRKVPAEWGIINFEYSPYLNAQNKKQPAYNLTRDGFTLLAMGYNSVRAIKWKLKYIEAFNALEQVALEAARQDAFKKALATRRRLTPAYRALMRRALRYRGMGLELREIGKLMDCSHQKIFYMLKDAAMIGLGV